MKKKFPLLIVLMLTLSMAHAQSTEVVEEIEASKTISVSNEEGIVFTDTIINPVKEDIRLLIDTSKLKETISRTSSDIRVYLNRKRKAGNISFVFPKINKAVRA